MKKINKNLIALVIAIILALIVAFLLKMLVDKKISDSLQRETVSYIVANADLTNGILVDPFDSSAFAVRSDIPADLAQSNAITPDQADAIAGALLLADMKRGDILTWQMIDTDERKQLANRLLPGRRALTIPVDAQSSISSMLKPNDRIDLILSYDKEGIVVAAPLLQNVRVIATGDNVGENSMYSESDSNYYTNITLDLSIEDVSRVTMAMDLGRMSAVLRNPEDLSHTDKVISLETLQQELRLRTINNRQDTSHPDPDWAALYEEQLRIMQANQNAPMPEATVIPEPKPQHTPKSTINIIYGNHSSQE